MPIRYSKKVISSMDAEKIVALSESWIVDMKGKDIKPAKLSRNVSAFANSNGGEIYLGISYLDDKDQYSLINNTVATVKEIVEKVGVISKDGKESKIYPDVTLHEIITNAVLHRDYSIPKDIS